MSIAEKLVPSTSHASIASPSVEEKVRAGWSLVRLGEICKTATGGTPNRKFPEYFQGDVPWVKSGELPDGMVLENQEFISDKAIQNSNAKVFPAGTLLIALYGATVGKLGILSKAAATNQAICAIFPPEDLDSKYLFWYLRSIRADLVAQAVGGAQPNISQGILRNLSIPLAPPDQQKHIVAEIEKQFSRLDEAVANLKRVKANLKRYKAAVLKAAVEGRLVETEAELARREGRSYETGAQLLQRILETRRSQWKGKGKYKEPAAPDTTDLPALPEGWVWALVGQAFDVYVGSTPSRAKAEYWSGGIPWVSSGEVAFCRIKSTRETISSEGFENSSTNLHPVGTVLLGMIGEGKTRGQAAILDIEACNNQNSAAIRVSETDVLPEYVYSFLEKEYEETRRRGSGGNQPALNKERVRQIPFPLPPVDEQLRITAELDRLLSLIQETGSQVDADLKRTVRLQESILKQAFMGGGPWITGAQI